MTTSNNKTRTERDLQILALAAANMIVLADDLLSILSDILSLFIG
ncbi:hypothetical protein [Celeribacter sp.]